MSTHIKIGKMEIFNQNIIGKTDKICLFYVGKKAKMILSCKSYKEINSFNAKEENFRLLRILLYT